MKPRNLKIEATGDFWRKQVKPRIRLTGHWLDQAGFKAGSRVKVELAEPGVLTLRFIAESPGTAPDAR